MTDVYDTDKLAKQAVIEFGSISRKKLSENQDTQSAENSGAAPEVNYSKEQMQARIATARMHANKEIEKYRELVETFNTEVSKLVLFKNVGITVKHICIDHILEGAIDPILKGALPFGMPEDLFRDVRRQFYKELMDRYVK